MRRAGHGLVWAVAAVVCSGCATMTGQPSMGTASILPDDLKPGDTAVITVKIEDKFHVVSRVEGVVKEDRTITFRFEDNGVPPDDKAGDGIWTIQVDVPFNAPPGDFHFEVAGFDASGNLLVVEDKKGEAAPLSTAFPLVIQYPAETDAAPAATTDAPPAPGAAAPGNP